jgi:low affinity Fe/Cu permease
MTLIIQRAEDRDTQALQAKLDELLRANRSADTQLTKIDTLEPEEIKRLREQS